MSLSIPWRSVLLCLMSRPCARCINHQFGPNKTRSVSLNLDSDTAPYSRRNIFIPSPDMSTGSLSDADEFHDAELLDGLLPFGSDRDTAESSNSEGAHTGHSARTPGKRRRAAASRRAGAGAGTGTDSGAALPEGKQVQRNAANARERARMRVLSKAFSRLKTTLPWVPPDTKLSKLDTLRLASSYIAHLRQILANDKHEHGYIHPVNLTWPFMVAGKPENELKEMMNSTRLCGTTAS